MAIKIHESGGLIHIEFEAHKKGFNVCCSLTRAELVHVIETGEFKLNTKCSNDYPLYDHCGHNSNVRKIIKYFDMEEDHYRIMELTAKKHKHPLLKLEMQISSDGVCIGIDKVDGIDCDYFGLSHCKEQYKRFSKVGVEFDDLESKLIEPLAKDIEKRLLMYAANTIQIETPWLYTLTDQQVLRYNTMLTKATAQFKKDFEAMYKQEMLDG